MKKKFNGRISAFFLSLVMVLAFLPLQAMAVNYGEGDCDVKFVFNSGGTVSYSTTVDENNLSPIASNDVVSVNSGDDMTVSIKPDSGKVMTNITLSEDGAEAEPLLADDVTLMDDGTYIFENVFIENNQIITISFDIDKGDNAFEASGDNDTDPVSQFVDNQFTAFIPEGGTATYKIAGGEAESLFDNQPIDFNTGDDITFAFTPDTVGELKYITVSRESDDSEGETIYPENMTASSDGISYSYTMENLTQEGFSIEIFWALDENVSDNYNIDIQKPKHGTITYEVVSGEMQTPDVDADFTTFKVSSGTIMKLTFTPEDGYKLAEISLSDEMIIDTSDESLTQVEPGSNIYSYLLEDISDNYTIKASFVPEFLPTKPYDIEVSEITSNSVELSWTEPDYNYENITDYVVNFTSDKHSKSGVSLDTTDTNAVVSGLKPNTEYSFTVQAKNEYGLSEKSGTINAKTKKLLVSKISLKNKEYYIDLGKKLILKPTVSPADATNKTLEWKSKNTKVATVSSTGKVSAKSVGVATLTVKAKDGSGKSFTVKIIVRPSKPSVVKLSKINSNSLKFSYKKVSSANKYQVFMKINNKKYVSLGLTSSFSVIKKNLKSGNSYTFKVRAYNSATKIYSDFSSTKTYKL